MESVYYIILHPNSEREEKSHIPIPPLLPEIYDAMERVRYSEKNNEYYINGFDNKIIIFEWAYFKNNKLTVDRENFYKNKVYKLFYNNNKQECYVYDMCRHYNCYCSNRCTFVHLNKLIKEKRKFQEELEIECDYYLENYKRIKKENKELKYEINNKKLETIKEESI